MIRRILVPLDGSARAERVLPYAARIASAFGACVDLVHAIPQRAGRAGITDPLVYRLAHADGTRYLEGQAAELRRQGLEVSTSIEEGGAAEVIVDLLRCGSYDLVALTPHGLGCATHLRMGSTVVAVILNARTSILIVPEDAELGDPESSPGGTGVVMAPVDCSPRSDWSVAVAATIARKSAARLDLVHVLGMPEVVSRLPTTGAEGALARRIVEANRIEAHRYLEQTAWRLRGSGLPVRERLVDASVSPAEALRTMMKAERPILVVLSAHGRGASEEWPLGGTAAKLIFWAQRPVLILQDLPVERTRPRWSPQLSRGEIQQR